MEDKTAYANGKKLVGTMPNNETLEYEPSDEEQSIPLGYTSGGIIKAADITKLQEYQTCLGITESILNIPPHPYVVNDLFTFYNGSMIDSINQNNGTLYGTYTQAENSIIFNGGYAQTGNISKSKGTWEIYCKINSNFSPKNTTQWYNCSCIFGVELSSIQQDFGIVIDKNGNYAIGYSESSIASTSIKANDDQFHHLVLITEDTKLMLYIDGNLEQTVNYTMSGTISQKYGLFYNMNSTDTIVKGDFKTFRYYTRSLANDEIQMNYNSCLVGGE